MYGSKNLNRLILVFLEIFSALINRLIKIDKYFQDYLLRKMIIDEND